MPIALWALVVDVDEDGESDRNEAYVMALAPGDNERALYPEFEDNLRGHVFKPEWAQPNAGDPR